MSEPSSEVPGRVRRHAIASVVLWLLVVATAWICLASAAARQPGSEDRFGAGGDSIALPVVALGIWLAIALLAINLAAAIVLVVRQRRRGR